MNMMFGETEVSKEGLRQRSEELEVYDLNALKVEKFFKISQKGGKIERPRLRSP
jgi:hypothetical protein